MSWVLNEEVMAVLAAILIVSAVFAGVQVFNAGRVVEPFSELGLLGPGGKIGDYPSRVVAGTPFLLNVYVGNHEGRTVYYKVLVKLGDNSSIVNESTPLQAEPLAEVRVILTHNASKTIPVNITLREAATRVRLVFEMWVFNETAQVFTYHGRWNQLWLNVTEPPLEASPPQASVKVSLETESKLREGFLSVRRAEEAGGNVSEMVDLLNRAAGLAENGDEAEAENLVSRVLAMEPEVSTLGMQAERTSLYTSVTIVAVGLTISLGCFAYLRRRIWVYWAKFYGDRGVVWSGGESGLTGLEKAVRKLVKSSDGNRLGSLVSSLGGRYGAHEAARTLYNLAKRRVVRLIDPDPPGSFAGYVFSNHSLGFTIAVLLIVLCMFTVYFSGLSPALAAARMVLGSLFTLFLPGYSLVEALYPREDELSPLERLALSIGLSLALVPLVGLILNYTPWGIRLDPIMVALSTLTLTLLVVSAYRKYRILGLKAYAEAG